MQAFFAWLLKVILEFLYGKAKEEIKKEVNERQAKEAEHKKAEDARNELKKPIDESKSKEDQRKEAEQRADDFFNRLRRK